MNQEYNISKVSVSKWFDFINKLIFDYPDNNEKINGSVHIIEINETHVFRNKRRIRRIIICVGY